MKEKKIFKLICMGAMLGLLTVLLAVTAPTANAQLNFWPGSSLGSYGLTTPMYNFNAFSPMGTNLTVPFMGGITGFNSYMPGTGTSLYMPSLQPGGASFMPFNNPMGSWASPQIQMPFGQMYGGWNMPGTYMPAYGPNLMNAGFGLGMTTGMPWLQTPVMSALGMTGLGTGFGMPGLGALGMPGLGMSPFAPTMFPGMFPGAWSPYVAPATTPATTPATSVFVPEVPMATGGTIAAGDIRILEAMQIDADDDTITLDGLSAVSGGAGAVYEGTVAASTIDALEEGDSLKLFIDATAKTIRMTKVECTEVAAEEYNCVTLVAINAEFDLTTGDGGKATMTGGEGSIVVAGQAAQPCTFVAIGASEPVIN